MQPQTALSRWLLLGALFIAVPCAAQSEDPDPGEPNDSLEQARPAALNQAVRFYLTHPNDKDHFRFQVKRTGTLQIQWGGLPTKEPPDAAVLNRTSERVKQWSGQPLRLSPGDYFLAIRAKIASVSWNPMVFKLFFVPDIDLHEPNDFLGSATPARFTEEIRVALEPAGDVDWFKISLPERGYLTEILYNVSFPGKPKDWHITQHQPTGIRLDVYTEKGDRIGSFKDDWYFFQEARREVFLKNPGPVYVRVYQETALAQPVSFGLQFDFLREAEVKNFGGRRGRSGVIFLDLSEPNSSDRIEAILLSKRKEYTHIPVDQAQTQLKGAFEKAVRETALPTPKFPWALLVLLLVVVLAAGLFSRRKKTR